MNTVLGCCTLHFEVLEFDSLVLPLGILLKYYSCSIEPNYYSMTF
jgi:hypothetical protein